MAAMKLRPISLASTFLLVPAALLAFGAGCKGSPSPTPADDGANGSGGGTTMVAASASVAPSSSAAQMGAPSASVAAFVNPAQLPPYEGPTGSVEGTLTITGDASPNIGADQDFSKCPAAANLSAKLFREGAAVAGGRALADAIVAVTGYSGYYVPERAPVRRTTIDGCAMSERVIAMTMGQQLEVLNKSKELWAPMIEQAQLPALMVAPPGGDAVKLYPPHPGHFTIADKMGHPWAKADLWVLMQPLHAVTDLDGHYRIDGVPVGALTVSARLTNISQETSKPVTIAAGVVQKVDLTLTYSAKGDAGTRRATRDAGASPAIK